MTDKAVISEYTWRSKAMQKAELANMPCFVLPEDNSALFRPTRRQARDVLHVVSLAVIAEEEKDFREFVKSTWKIGASIKSHEDGALWEPGRSLPRAVASWKAARKTGAAKIGASISAANRRARSADGIAKIKERWPLLSSEWSTADLLKEAGLSLNTAKAHLGKRPIAQYNYQAAQKRKERRNAKNHSDA